MKVQSAIQIVGHIIKIIEYPLSFSSDAQPLDVDLSPSLILGAHGWFRSPPLHSMIVEMGWE